MNAGLSIRQLPLPLPVRSEQGAADFLVADSNREALRWLDRWPDWPGGSLLLYGPEASGKTHLASIWAARAGADVVAADHMNLDRALALNRPMAVDDIERASQPNVLFHLLNTARARGLSLVLVARRPPSAWTTGLADLDSRLRALPGIRLAPPDDALLSGLAVKLFADRQIIVSDTVLAYMLARLERSCAAVAAAVSALDEAALVQQRPITVPLARAVLQLSDDD